MINIKIKKDSVNEQFIPIFTNDIPFQIYFGSSSSGKSYAITGSFAPLWAMQGRNILIVRKHANQLRKSVVPEVMKAISRMGLSEYFSFNKTDLILICKASGGSIMFLGADDPERMKSITSPVKGGIDCAILEEADVFSEEDVDTINSRLRGGSDFKKKLIMIFNPVSKIRSKWLIDRYFYKWDDESDEVYADEHVHIQRFNYYDNKFLTEDDVAKIESWRTRNPRFFRVYGLGRFGVSGRLVFENNFRIEDFDIINTRNLRALQEQTGADFGFNHPNAMVFTSYDPNLHKIYVWGEIRVREKTKVEFARIIKEKMLQLNVYNPVIRCDSAEPASIRELQQQGLRAIQANKGQDSLRRGLDFLQSNEIIIHPTCNQLFDEMSSLTYKKDKFGSYTEDVDDSTGDDLIASLRYAYSHIFMGTGTFKQSAVRY
jgi:phage terminase large subunit